MKAGFIFLLFIFSHAIILAQDTTQHIVPGRKNSRLQQQKPYVILISADGFRHDFAEKYGAANLIGFRDSGVAAHSMIPCFPTLTFPNHYSMVTGMYPAHHGLVDNGFYDKKRGRLYKYNDKKTVGDGAWYGGIPLWVLAEQQEMLSASFYWVGSEADIQKVRPTYYYNYNEKIEIDDRIQTVVSWLQQSEEKRPHFISFYFPEVDHEAHGHGPDSEEAGRAVKWVDESIGKLVAAVDALGLPINYIFVSDHGMAYVDYHHTLGLPPVVDTTKFIVPDGEAMLQLYAKNEEDIAPTYAALLQTAKNFDVYRKEDMPAQWHYGAKDDVFGRIGDILLIPQYPNIFSLKRKTTSPGKHGFGPEMEQMHASFYAWGPAFKKGLKVESFENVHIYLVARILGLSYQHKIDGKPGVLAHTLK